MAITRREALDLFQSDDLIGLGMEADKLRRSLHPENVVTYSLDRNIGGVHFDAINESGYEAIYVKLAETVDTGITAVRMQNFPSGLSIAKLEQMLRESKQRFPQLSLRCFSAEEVSAIAESNQLSLRETLRRLRDAGVDSILGGSVSVTERWIEVHRTAHQLGMRTIAAMVFGAGETIAQRVDQLEQLHSLQELNGGFAAFVPLSFQPRSAAERSEETTAIEYLKFLAISRLYLDNIENIQSSWAAQGLKVLQMGLRFGANDVGSPVPEENSAKFTTEEELRRVIRDAGFRPVQRDALYRTVILN